MSSHNYSVFKNSCIKTPVNPINRMPTTNYERIKSATSTKSDQPQSESNKSFNNTNSEKDNNNFMSLIDFYSSIPDFSEDIRNLSENEFYNKLETLKRKQKEFKNYYLSDDNKSSEKYYDSNEEKNTITSDEKYFKNFNNKPIKKIYDCTKFSDLYNKTPVRFSANEIICNNDEWKKNSISKKNSAKSVRISSLSPHFNFSDCDDDYLENKCKENKGNRKLPSPTIPQPFKMTQREEEERMLEDLMVSSKCFSPKENIKPREDGKQQFKANPVPLTSRIPLLKHIVAEQEHRNELAKLNSTIELQSQMKPFSFTEKQERGNSRCLSRSLSSPNLGTPTRNEHQFKAKPCPKNLYSNYFYHKMWEDEYFRNLNRKIRSEELLKQSKLPPSMQKRKTKKNCHHYQHIVTPDSSINNTANHFNKKSKRRKHNKKNRPVNNYEKLKSDEYTTPNKRNLFITTSTEPFQFETDKRSMKRLTKQPSTSSSNCSMTTYTYRRCSPTPIYQVGRNNLAATLRQQYSRKKIYDYQNEPEMVQPMRTNTNRRDWGVRKSPAWKSLYYDGTNDDDISLRLATRRAEEKLRQEEYNMSMELMRQRVCAAPLLLEGPTQWSPKVGKVTHNCGKEAQDKLLKKLQRKSRSASVHQHRNNNSKLSNYSLRSLPSSKHDDDDAESNADLL